MSDFYKNADDFVKELQQVDPSAASVVSDAISAGSTGGEVLMALRWNLQKLINADKLPNTLKTQAEKMIAQINETGV